jgi:methylmalonyl-CoA/ethylmalonyl-CoA epimerase
MSDGNMFELTEIGIAVEDLDKAIAKFEAVFGVKADPVLEFSTPGIEMRFTAVNVGDQRINLLQPLGDSGPVAQAIKHRGEGFFNVFLQVSDLDAAMERLRAAGVDLVEPEPRVFGANNYRGRAYESNRIIWIHPRSFHGLLVEVQEYEWTPGSERDTAGDGGLFHGIPEIGIAVKDLEQATAKFEAVFGVDAAPVVEAPVPGVEMRFNWVDVGEQRINLYQALGDSSPIARAIKRSGEGLFNVMLEVDELEPAIEALRAAGVEFVEQEPRVLTNGRHGGRPYERHRVMWTHPRSFHGMLVEIQEFDWAPAPA